MHQALGICREFNAKPESGAGIPRLYASAGIYPHNTHEANEAALAKLDNLLAQPEVIACGEIGLDYYHEGTPHEVQREILVRQLEIAAARKRPILIHCRPKDGAHDTWDDLFEILETHWRHTGLGGVMHCFSGGWEQARRSLDMGFLCSFAGNLTFPKSQPLRDVAAKLAPDVVLVETDAPYLAPVAASRPNVTSRPGWRIRRTFWRVCSGFQGKKLAPQPRKTFSGCLIASRTWETDRVARPEREADRGEVWRKKIRSIL